MGCTVTPWKCSAPTFSVTEVSIAAPGASDRVAIGEIQLHAADIGLVGDRLGEQLEHDGVADPVGRGRRPRPRGGDHGRDGGDAIGLQHLLGFGFGQDGPAASGALR